MLKYQHSYLILAEEMSLICHHIYIYSIYCMSGNKKPVLVGQSQRQWEEIREQSRKKKQDKISHNYSKQAHYFFPLSHCLIYSHMKGNTLSIAFQLTLWSDSSNFPFQSEINDVQIEDGKYQSICETAGSLTYELWYLFHVSITPH